MAIPEQDKLNRLLSKGIPHGAYFSTWLTTEGWSSQLVKCYCDSGWLERLCRGVVYRKGDPPQAYPLLASYQQQVACGFHIAAHSALELHGYMHFVPMGKPRLMVALHGKYVPEWLTLDRYDRTFLPVMMSSFAKSTETIAYNELQLPASSPEQAFAECLTLAPKHYSYMDLYLLMEQLTTLRPEVVTQVLQQTSNQRVKRLYLYMAEKAQHPWLEDIDTASIRLTTSPLSLQKGGTFINKYKLTIPTELAQYE